MVGYALSQLVLSCLFGDGGWGVCVFDYKLKDSNPGTLLMAFPIDVAQAWVSDFQG